MIMSKSETRVGTKAVLASWLASVKHITYTKYSNLPTEDKLNIQKEYGARNKEVVRVAGQSNRTQEGTSATV
jgi:hypothetical protein